MYAKKFIRASIAITSVFAAGVFFPSQAAPLGYSLEISGSANTPRFTLTNESENADIETFTFTIGNTLKNFDGIFDIAANGIGYDIEQPDEAIFGGARSDSIQIGYHSFSPGASFQFSVDIDDDVRGDTFEDYRFLFFNNGRIDNSVASVDFDNGESVVLTLPDYERNQDNMTVHTFNQIVDTADDPDTFPNNPGPVSSPSNNDPGAPVGDANTPVSTRSIPEPSPLALLVGGLCILFTLNTAMRRRFTKIR